MIRSQVGAYQALVAAARKQTASSEPLFNAAIEAFEPHFFSNMVLALEGHFIRRARALEMTDGNLLNEVRMLCNSMMNNSNVMCADGTIKYDLANSVLQYRVGDEIRLSQSDYLRHSSAFLADIERKYL